MKRRRLIVLCSIAALVIGAFVIWRAFFSAPTRLEYALNLDKLPESVSVQAEAEDIWTDYITLHSITLAPADFPRLLGGRSFAKASYFRPGIKTHEGYASHLPPIDVDVVYEVEVPAPDGAVCRVYGNKARTEAFIEFLAD